MTQQSIEFKSIPGQFNIDEAQGIVECFVAGIGNKDSVGDVLVSGAFSKSLTRRKPRVVWGHNWNDPIGKVLEIYEVPPGDRRLPVKMLNAGIGGLYAKVQFNLNSEKGREAFSNVAFFGQEQEWSIGYKTLDSIFDPNLQANVLKEVELYEVSPVLHGANQLTGTISVKADDGTITEKGHGHMMMVGMPGPMMGRPTGMMKPRTPNVLEAGKPSDVGDERRNALEMELAVRAGAPVKVRMAEENSVIFDRITPDGQTTTYRVSYHFTGKEFMFGKPEKVSVQTVYMPVSDESGSRVVVPSQMPSMPMQVKPQGNAYFGDDNGENRPIMPKSYNDEKWDFSDDIADLENIISDSLDVKVGRALSAKNMSKLKAILENLQDVIASAEKDVESKTDYIIPVAIENAFETKQLLDPIFDYHRVESHVTEDGIVITTGITNEFIEAIGVAEKALGRTLGRGLGKLGRAARGAANFDPNAWDGDGDGLVQEGTPYERPAIPGVNDRSTGGRVDARAATRAWQRQSGGLRSTTGRDDYDDSDIDYDSSNTGLYDEAGGPSNPRPKRPKLAQFNDPVGDEATERVYLERELQKPQPKKQKRPTKKQVADEKRTSKAKRTEEAFNSILDGESLKQTASKTGMTAPGVRAAVQRYMRDNPEAVDEAIYNRRMDGESLDSVGKKLGLTRESVRKAELRHMRRNPETTGENDPRAKTRVSKLPGEKRDAEIYERRMNGETLDAVGRDMGMTREQVRKAEQRHMRKNPETTGENDPRAKERRGLASRTGSTEEPIRGEIVSGPGAVTPAMKSIDDISSYIIPIPEHREILKDILSGVDEESMDLDYGNPGEVLADVRRKLLKAINDGKFDDFKQRSDYDPRSQSLDDYIKYTIAESIGDAIQATVSRKPTRYGRLNARDKAVNDALEEMISEWQEGLVEGVKRTKKINIPSQQEIDGAKYQAERTRQELLDAFDSPEAYRNSDISSENFWDVVDEIVSNDPTIDVEELLSQIADEIESLDKQMRDKDTIDSWSGKRSEFEDIKDDFQKIFNNLNNEYFQKNRRAKLDELISSFDDTIANSRYLPERITAQRAARTGLASRTGGKEGPSTPSGQRKLRKFDDLYGRNPSDISDYEKARKIYADYADHASRYGDMDDRESPEYQDFLKLVSDRYGISTDKADELIDRAYKSERSPEKLSPSEKAEAAAYDWINMSEQGSLSDYDEPIAEIAKKYGMSIDEVVEAIQASHNKNRNGSSGLSSRTGRRQKPQMPMSRARVSRDGKDSRTLGKINYATSDSGLLVPDDVIVRDVLKGKTLKQISDLKGLGGERFASDAIGREMRRLRRNAAAENNAGDIDIFAYRANGLSIRDTAKLFDINPADVIRRERRAKKALSENLTDEDLSYLRRSMNIDTLARVLKMNKNELRRREIKRRDRTTGAPEKIGRSGLASRISQGPPMSWYEPPYESSSWDRVGNMTPRELYEYGTRSWDDRGQEAGYIYDHLNSRGGAKDKESFVSDLTENMDDMISRIEDVDIFDKDDPRDKGKIQILEKLKSANAEERKQIVSQLLEDAPLKEEGSDEYEVALNLIAGFIEGNIEEKYRRSNLGKFIEDRLAEDVVQMMDNEGYDYSGNDIGLASRTGGGLRSTLNEANRRRAEGLTPGTGDSTRRAGRRTATGGGSDAGSYAPNTSERDKQILSRLRELGLSDEEIETLTGIPNGGRPLTQADEDELKEAFEDAVQDALSRGAQEITREEARRIIAEAERAGFPIIGNPGLRSSIADMDPDDIDDGVEEKLLMDVDMLERFNEILEDSDGIDETISEIAQEFNVPWEEAFRRITNARRRKEDNAARRERRLARQSRNQTEYEIDEMADRQFREDRLDRRGLSSRTGGQNIDGRGFSEDALDGIHSDTQNSLAEKYPDYSPELIEAIKDIAFNGTPEDFKKFGDKYEDRNGKKLGEKKASELANEYYDDWQSRVQQTISDLDEMDDRQFREDRLDGSGLRSRAGRPFKTENGTINPHKKLDIELEEAEIGVLREEIDAMQKLSEKPDALMAFGKKLEQSTNGKFSVDKDEYEAIAKEIETLRRDRGLISSDVLGVLEQAADSSTGKYSSIDVRGGRGLASKNNGAPSDIPETLQKELINWARRQPGLRVARSIIEDHDKNDGVLKASQWKALRTMYENMGPGGGGGGRRGIFGRGKSKVPEKPKREAVGKAGFRIDDTPDPMGTAKPSKPDGKPSASRRPANDGDGSELVVDGWQAIPDSQGGSQPGGKFIDPNSGQEFYVKQSRTKLHSENESLVSRLYERLGVGAGKVRKARWKNSPAVASEWIPGSRSVDHGSKIKSDPKWKKAVQDSYVATAWLANWDATANSGNIVQGGDGKPYIIDTGGGILFRARGDAKGSRFGAEVTEMESLKDAGLNRLGSQYFSDVPPEEIARQVKVIGGISDKEIRKMVEDSITDKAKAKEVADTLIARRDYLVKNWSTGKNSGIGRRSGLSSRTGLASRADDAETGAKPKRVGAGAQRLADVEVRGSRIDVEQAGVGRGGATGGKEETKFKGKSFDDVKPENWEDLTIDEKWDWLLGEGNPANGGEMSPAAYQGAMKRLGEDEEREEMKKMSPEERRRAMSQKREEDIKFGLSESARARSAKKIQDEEKAKKTVKPVKEESNAEKALENRQKLLDGFNDFINDTKDVLGMMDYEEDINPDADDIWNVVQGILGVDDITPKSLREAIDELEMFIDTSGGDTKYEKRSVAQAKKLLKKLTDMQDRYQGDKWFNRGEGGRSGLASRSGGRPNVPDSNARNNVNNRRNGDIKRVNELVDEVLRELERKRKDTGLASRSGLSSRSGRTMITDEATFFAEVESSLPKEIRAAEKAKNLKAVEGLKKLQEIIKKAEASKTGDRRTNVGSIYATMDEVDIILEGLQFALDKQLGREDGGEKRIGWYVKLMEKMAEAAMSTFIDKTTSEIGSTKRTVTNQRGQQKKINIVPEA